MRMKDEEAGRGGGGVLEELEAGVAGGELRRGDARADHGRRQEGRAEELGEGARRARGASITARS